MRPILIATLCFASVLPIAAADWLTDGGNPQRTAWQKDEKILSLESVKGMKLLWKMHLDNQPREMHSLFPPLIVDKVNTLGGRPATRDCGQLSPTTSSRLTWKRKARWSGPSTSPVAGLRLPAGCAAAASFAPVD